MLATIGNADIYFSDEGEGNPVVFVHGLGGRSTNWAYQRRYFQRDYRVICPDLPGHGASSGHALSFQSFAGRFCRGKSTMRTNGSLSRTAYAASE
ncbi:alpha/beta fold hydrolase [Paraburkholderia hospita]|jgi:pimeloyl-ACP methyl ester carboxylesterase|uniref:alpha/beta fold hydrolase n=1 Tax=Paraburkholderia hospita TaxID=169430 RepID=UPI003F50C5FE